MSATPLSIAYKRRHILLLKKIKAGRTLTASETAELARYEKESRKRGPAGDPLRDERVAQRKLMANKRAKDRDIAIDFSSQDMKRRAKGRRYPQFFLRTYFPHIFYLPFSDNQKKNIRELVIRIKQGGMKAIATERGGGKTSIMKGLVVWGLLYGRIRWVAWIEANLNMAKDSLEDIKLMFEQPGESFAADFPEYCNPIAQLHGQALRARSMTYAMKRTGMKWEVDRLILPTIAAEHTPHKTAALGGIIQVFGAEKPIRGLVRAGNRPDFVAINDIETEETAKSLTMTENIRRNLVNAVGGLGGPGKKIGMAMLCTIIRKGCIGDQLTDRDRYPMWVGERMKMLIAEPANRDLWETYIHLRQTEQRAGNPDCRKAERFYRKNRAAMDKGAKVANRLRYITSPGLDKKPLEISAIQHVFNIISDRGIEYFLCECQNDPPDELTATAEITPHVIAEKVSGIKRGSHPGGDKTIAFVDVHDAKLYWAVVAFRQKFIGCVFDYGVEPVHSPIAGSVSKHEKIRQVDIAIIESLHKLRTDRESTWGADLILVDCGYKDTAVYTFCSQVPGGLWRPAKGGSSRVGAYTAPKKSRTVRGVGDGYHWSYLAEKRIWILIHDTTKWKRRAQDGFLAPEVDGPGSLSLFSSEAVDHRAFGEQIVAEAYNIEKKKFEKVRGLRHNHWLDCVAGCCCGAAVMGIRLTPVPGQIKQGQGKAVGRRRRRTINVPKGARL